MKRKLQNRTRKDVRKDISRKATRYNFGGIRLKLIVAFFIPVMFIVVLGLISFNKASTAITKNYESAALKTVESTAEL